MKDLNNKLLRYPCVSNNVENILNLMPLFDPYKDCPKQIYSDFSLRIYKSEIDMRGKLNIERIKQEKQNDIMRVLEICEKFKDKFLSEFSKFEIDSIVAIGYYNALIEKVKNGLIKEDELPNYGMNFHLKIDSLVYHSKINYIPSEKAYIKASEKGIEVKKIQLTPTLKYRNT